jgi:prepilin-type N-terminal cleavage/methylation domain-containing protein
LKKIKGFTLSYEGDFKKEQGFSLIEVMLAALILSFGLLGFVQGQLMALRVSEYAYFINLADLKNNELAERVRSCSNKSNCVQEQLTLWKKEIRKVFPQGEEDSRNQGFNYQSTISWFSVYLYPRFIRTLHLHFRL